MYTVQYSFFPHLWMKYVHCSVLFFNDSKLYRGLHCIPLSPISELEVFSSLLYWFLALSWFRVFSSSSISVWGVFSVLFSSVLILSSILVYTVFLFLHLCMRGVLCSLISSVLILSSILVYTVFLFLNLCMRGVLCSILHWFLALSWFRVFSSSPISVWGVFSVLFSSVLILSFVLHSTVFLFPHLCMRGVLCSLLFLADS